MSTQAPTPESDREKFACNYTNPNGSFFGDCVELGFARKLEHERNEALTRIDELEGRSIHSCGDHCQRPACVRRHQLERERDEARQEIIAQAAQIAQLRAALEDALQHLKSCQSGKGCMINTAISKIEQALSYPPPPVVPLEDTRPLAEAIAYAIWHHNEDGEGAVDRLKLAFSAFTTKHPLP